MDKDPEAQEPYKEKAGEEEELVSLRKYLG